jgi:hypothetical protein
MIDREAGCCMIDPRNLDTLLHPQFDAAALKAATPIGKGLGCSPELLAVRSYSQLMTLLNGLQRVRRSSLFV